MNTEQQSPQNNESIYCGKCGAKNPITNTFCNQCGNIILLLKEMPDKLATDNLKPNKEDSHGNGAKSSTIYAIVGIATILTILVLWYLNTNNSNSKPAVNVHWLSSNESEKKDAYTVSEGFVKEKLRYPNTAAFPSNYTSVRIDDQSIYTVISYVDGLNAYQQPVRINYMVKMRYIGGDLKDIQNWKLLDVRLDDTQ